MARVIEFYIPDSLPKRLSCPARKEPGELIEFPSPKRNLPSSDSAQWPGIAVLYIAPFAANSVSDRTGDTM